MRNDDVAEESEADHSGRVLDVRSRLNIGGAGFRVPARVVVSEGEGPAVVAQHGVEDLADGHRRAVDGAL
ncbi:MAG: hypothetical protein V9G19_24750 [Tetrasphaera sp.]